MVSAAVVGGLRVSERQRALAINVAEEKAVEDKKEA